MLKGLRMNPDYNWGEGTCPLNPTLSHALLLGPIRCYTGPDRSTGVRAYAQRRRIRPIHLTQASSRRKPFSCKNIRMQRAVLDIVDLELGRNLCALAYLSD